MNEHQDGIEPAHRFLTRAVVIPLLVALIGGGGIIAFFKYRMPVVSQNAQTLASNSGRTSAEIKVGPFDKPTDILLEATNAVTDAHPRDGRVTVEIFFGEESLANGYRARSGRPQAVARKRCRVPAHKEVIFTAKGSCSHARPDKTELIAYTVP
jgi:hypothetical protein